MAEHFREQMGSDTGEGHFHTTTPAA